MVGKSISLIFFIMFASNSFAKLHEAKSNTNWQTRNKDLIFAHQHRAIERLVFTSGGVKGGVYPGVLSALALTELLAHVKMVSGSSAGAIIAALIAVGIDPKILYEDLRQTNFLDLLGDKVGSWYGNKKGIAFFTRDGKNLLEHGRRLINNVIITFLSSTRWKQSKKSPEELAFAKRFLNDQRFTFSDLNLLHQRFPDKFKDLTTIAVLFSSGDVRVYNNLETPEIEIAMAVRASASIPAVFEPLEIVYKNKPELHVDGGLYELLPADYFDRGQDGNYLKNQKPEKTLLFSFADKPEYQESSIFKALHGSRANELALLKLYSNATAPEEARFFQPSWIEKMIRNNFVKYLGEFEAPYSHQARWDQTFHEIYAHYHHNTVALGNGELIALNFPAGTKWARELLSIGYIDTMNFIIAHELYDKKSFNADKYYWQLVKSFSANYKSLLFQMNLSLAEDSFAMQLKELDRKLIFQLKNNTAGVRAEQLCAYIRDSIRNNLDSRVAFALALAVEQSLGFLSAAELKKDIGLRAKQ